MSDHFSEISGHASLT